MRISVRREPTQTRIVPVAVLTEQNVSSILLLAEGTDRVREVAWQRVERHERAEQQREPVAPHYDFVAEQAGR